MAENRGVVGSIPTLAISRRRLPWTERLSQQPVAVIGAPLDLGQDRRGVDMGPSAIRYAGLDQRLEEIGRACHDWGNVGTAVAEAVAEGAEELRFLDAIKATCAQVASSCAEPRLTALCRSCSAATTRSRSGRSPACTTTSRAACSGSTRTVT